MAEQNPFAHLKAQPAAEPQRAAPTGPVGVVVPKEPEKPKEPAAGYEPDPNRPGSWRPIPGGPADPQVKGLTESESKAVGFYQRMRSAETQMKRMGMGPQDWSTLIQQRISPTFSRANLSDRQRTQLDLMENWIAASMRLESGAAIAPDEFEKQARIFFPQPGAGLEEQSVKDQQRELAILGFRAVAGPGAKEADANLRSLGFIDEAGKPIILPVARDEQGREIIAPELRVAEGAEYSTDADFQRQRDAAEAWAATQGLPFDQALSQFNAAMQSKGYAAADPQTVNILQWYEQNRPGNRGAVEWALPKSGLRASEAPGRIAALGSGLLTGGTAGLAEEAVGLFDPEAAAKLEAAKRYARENYAGTELLGEVIGGFTSPLSRIGRGGTIGGEATRGAVYGGLMGAGEPAAGADLTERLTQGVIGAGLGGAIGGAAQRVLGGRLPPGVEMPSAGGAPEMPAAAVASETGPAAAVTPEAPPMAPAAPSVAPAAPAMAFEKQQNQTSSADDLLAQMLAFSNAPSSTKATTTAPIGQIKTIELPLNQKMFLGENGAQITVMEGAKFAPRKNSITDFVVPEEYRGSGIGGQLLDNVLSRYNPSDISAAVSSDPSVALFYKRGFRPISNPNASLDEAMAIRRDQSSVTMVIPEAPPMATAAPTGMAEEVVVEAATMTPQEIGDLARRAIGRGPGSAKAKSQLATIAKSNSEAVAAANRLGLELPVDVLSDNAQLRSLTGLARSEVGSEAETAWGETARSVIQRANQAMDELGATTDLTQVSADVFKRVDDAQKSLGNQASLLREEVEATFNTTDRVEPTRIREWLQSRIDELGGGKEGLAALSPEEKKLWGVVSKGQPTYARLNEARDMIGQALNNGTGPWADANLSRVKQLYGALADDQINFIEATAGKEIADKQRAANTLFQEMFKGREQMQDIFGKDLSKSLVPLMQRAITSGSKGDISALNQLVSSVPEDMRGTVLTSALFNAAKTRSGARGAEEMFSFTNFSKIYRDLRNNKEVYKQIAKAVGPEGDRLLTDLYAISRRMADAESKVLKTGKANQALDNSLNAERLLNRVLKGAGARLGAATVGGVAAGPVGVAVAGGLTEGAQYIAQGMGKKNADKVHALLSSEQFRNLIDNVGSGGNVDQAINRVASSRPFIDYLKSIGVEAKQAKNWLRSAFTVAPVSGITRQAESQQPVAAPPMAAQQ